MCKKIQKIDPPCQMLFLCSANEGMQLVVPKQPAFYIKGTKQELEIPNASFGTQKVLGKENNNKKIYFFMFDFIYIKKNQI